MDLWQTSGEARKSRMESKKKIATDVVQYLCAQGGCYSIESGLARDLVKRLSALPMVALGQLRVLLSLIQKAGDPSK